MKSFNFKLWIVTVGLSLGLFTAPTSADLVFDFGGTAYELIETGRTWLEAAADSVSRTNQGLPGQLVRIDSQAENDAIFDALIGHIDAADFGKTLGPDGGGGSYVWIGATDRGTDEGQWIWDGDGDGAGTLFWKGKANGMKEDDLYNNWGMFPDTDRQTEPDDFGPGQDAAGISLNGWPLGTAGQWNDVDEANDLYYVVEYEEASPVVIPGDANLDRQFNTDDIIQVLGFGLFESGRPATWESGDWDRAPDPQFTYDTGPPARKRAL